MSIHGNRPGEGAAHSVGDDIATDTRTTAIAQDPNSLTRAEFDAEFAKLAG